MARQKKKAQKRRWKKLKEILELATLITGIISAIYHMLKG